VAGARRQVDVHRVGTTRYLDSALGAATLHELPRFPEPGSEAAPGSLLAPMPGTVVRIAAGVGQPVRAGTTVVVFEAMKMEHPVKAPAAGTVAEVLVEVGQTVDAGEALAVIVETMEDL
jgi:biotin carboxyl carrier protein